MEVRSELERLLGEHFGGPCRIVELDQRPNPYRSSFAMQELDLVLEDGRALELIVKDLGRHALDEGGSRAKPEFAHDPARELEVYRAILGREQLGTALCYGAVADVERGSLHLVLERVPADRLAFVGEFERWETVARWLARMHDRLAPLVAQLPEETAERLLSYDADFYWRWLEYTATAVGNGAADPALVRRLAGLRATYGRLVDELLQLPATIVHGEFYPENVLVEESQPEFRVCPVDWEMAGVAPGVVDVAGLTAGSWTDDERRRLALAYHGALEGQGLPAEEFLSALALARVQLALQWAGTAPSREQAERWLTEALDVAEGIGL